MESIYERNQRTLALLLGVPEGERTALQRVSIAMLRRWLAGCGRSRGIVNCES